MTALLVLTKGYKCEWKNVSLVLFIFLNFEPVAQKILSIYNIINIHRTFAQVDMDPRVGNKSQGLSFQ